MLPPPYLFLTTFEIYNLQSPTLISSNSTFPHICHRPPEKMTTIPAEDVGALSLELSARHDIHYYLTEGLEGIEHQQYRGVKAFIRAIESQAKELYSGNAGQYKPRNWVRANRANPGLIRVGLGRARRQGVWAGSGRPSSKPGLARKSPK